MHAHDINGSMADKNENDIDCQIKLYSHFRLIEIFVKEK